MGWGKYENKGGGVISLVRYVGVILIIIVVNVICIL